MTDTYIGVIDCNNFFVSCERLFRPDLLRRPVVVLSSNDGCVVARSQEIKDMGIPMGIPYFQIKDSLKDSGAAVFSSNFTLYRDVSRRVFRVARELLSNFEQYSIDEGFFLVPASDAKRVAVLLRRRILKEVGIPVSVGLAASKTLAKWANGRAKKTDGICILSAAEWEVAARTVGMGEVWGVGGRLAQAYTRAGITTAADLMMASTQRVAALFGVVGVRLQAELCGTAVYQVQGTHEFKKSITNSRSFKNTTHSLAVLCDAVAYHVRRGVEELRQNGLRAQKMKIFIESSRFTAANEGGGVRVIELTAPSDDQFVFLRFAAAAVEALYDKDVAYKKAGVVLCAITPTGQAQGTLFAPEKAAVHESLLSAIEAVNRRFGQDVVSVGNRLKNDSWEVRRQELSPAYTTQWKALRTVRAS